MAQPDFQVLPLCDGFAATLPVWTGTKPLTPQEAERFNRKNLLWLQRLVRIAGWE